MKRFTTHMHTEVASRRNLDSHVLIQSSTAVMTLQHQNTRKPYYISMNAYYISMNAIKRAWVQWLRIEREPRNFDSNLTSAMHSLGGLQQTLHLKYGSNNIGPTYKTAVRTSAI